MADQALTDARAASKISCESSRLSTARAMTIAPTNVAYVLIAFWRLAAFDLPGEALGLALGLGDSLGVGVL